MIVSKQVFRGIQRLTHQTQDGIHGRVKVKDLLTVGSRGISGIGAVCCAGLNQEAVLVHI